MNKTNFTLESAGKSVLLGCLGGGVDALAYPFDRIKVYQQLQDQNIRIDRAARTIFQQEGISGFYKGLSLQLAKNIRQVWCWPMMTGIPIYLERYQLGDLQKSFAAGGFIATMNTAMIPLERARIEYIAKNTFSFRNIMQDGLRGFTIYGSKIYVGWISFLMTQQYFRNQSGVPAQQALPFSKATEIGVKAGLVQSVVWAPFDYMSTQKLANNRGIFHTLSRTEIRKVYRGWPASACGCVPKHIVLGFLLNEAKRTCKKSDSTLP